MTAIIATDDGSSVYGFKKKNTSRSLRPNSNTSSINVSLVSLESPPSSSSSSPRRASSSSVAVSLSLSAAALRVASVLLWTRVELLCAREAIAGAMKRSNRERIACLDRLGNRGACTINVKKKEWGVNIGSVGSRKSFCVKLDSEFLLRLCPLPDPTWRLWSWRRLCNYAYVNASSLPPGSVRKSQTLVTHNVNSQVETYELQKSTSLINVIQYILIHGHATGCSRRKSKMERSQCNQPIMAHYQHFI